MRTNTEIKVKLLGVREAMGVDEPARVVHGWPSGISVTDTGLPVTYEYDEHDDHASTIVQQYTNGAGAFADDLGHGGADYVVAVHDHSHGRDHGHAQVAGQDAGHHPAKQANQRVRSYSVAYYRSQYAQDTAAEVMPGPPVRDLSDARCAAHHLPLGNSHVHPAQIILYAGRHRHF